jgi:hypothetical protein
LPDHGISDALGASIWLWLFEPHGVNLICRRHSMPLNLSLCRNENMRWLGPWPDATRGLPGLWGPARPRLLIGLARSAGLAYCRTPTPRPPARGQGNWRDGGLGGRFAPVENPSNLIPFPHRSGGGARGGGAPPSSHPARQSERLWGSGWPVPLRPVQRTGRRGWALRRNSHCSEQHELLNGIGPKPRGTRPRRSLRPAWGRLRPRRWGQRRAPPAAGTCWRRCAVATPRARGWCA